MQQMLHNGTEVQNFSAVSDCLFGHAVHEYLSVRILVYLEVGRVNISIRAAFTAMLVGGESEKLGGPYKKCWRGFSLLRVRDHHQNKSCIV